MAETSEDVALVQRARELTHKTWRRPGRSSLVVAALLAAASASALVLGTSAANAAFPGGNGQFLYWSGGQIFQSDSGALTSGEYRPRYSADGTMVTFSRRSGSGSCDLFIMAADGSTFAQVTDSSGCYQAPAFSPDGTRLAYVRDGALGVINTDGTGETTIFSSASPGGVGPPVWSPDGDRIAFTDGRPCFCIGSDIYTINSDGSGLALLTSDTDGIGNHVFSTPDWAPDGSQLVFTQEASSGAEGWPHPGLYVANADGTNLHPILLTQGCPSATAGVWSPDGNRIGYSDCGTGDFDVYMMDTDGSNRTRVLGSPGTHEYLADWQASPPGSVSVPPAPPPAMTLRQVQGFDVAADGTLAQTGVRSGEPDQGHTDLYVSPPAGGLTRITFDGANEGVPSIADDHRVVYAPNGRQIVMRNADGSGRVELSEFSASCGLGAPAIAPDASMVVYTNFCTGTLRVDPDGSNTAPLGPSGVLLFTTEFSSDGTRVAGSCYDSTTSENGVCTLDSDGSNLTRVVDGQWDGATWSPDGSRLASFDQSGSTPELYVFNADGSSPEVVPTPAGSLKTNPRWLPDGRIGFVFSSDGGVTSEIRYVTLDADADGDGVSDSLDNCPSIANPDQANADGDSLGDVCDPDANGDGIADTLQPAGTPSGSFSNAVQGKATPTTGTVVSGSVSVDDLADPTKGVRITATSDAVLTVCQGFQLEIPAGAAVTITCGSVSIEDVTGGTVTVVSGTTEVAFPSNTSGTVGTTTSGDVTLTGVTGTGVTVTVGGVSAPVPSGNSNVIRGGSGNTSLTGTSGNDVIVDPGGNNMIDGKGGNDSIVVSGGGLNTVSGGGGHDTITTGSGNDTIDGGDGNDVINAGDGNNSVKGGSGDDRITAGSGNDNIDGGRGTDTCNADGGKDTLKNCEA